MKLSSHEPFRAQPFYRSDRPLHPANSFNPPRPVGLSILRGLYCRCPSCGVGRLFRRYLRLTEVCSNCGEELHHARPDDAPPYFVMLITGNIVVAAALAVEEAYAPPLLAFTVIVAIAAFVLSLALLPPIKGIVIAIQWANFMHGFDPQEREDVLGLAGQATPEAPQLNAKPECEAEMRPREASM